MADPQTLEELLAGAVTPTQTPEGEPLDTGSASSALGMDDSEQTPAPVPGQGAPTPSSAPAGGFPNSSEDPTALAAEDPNKPDLGSTIDPAIINALQAKLGASGANVGATSDTAQSAPNPSQVLQTASQTPPTNYDFFKGMSAADRANQARAILAKQGNGVSTALMGVAGVGDAIARSYGHDKEANAQGTLRGIQQNQLQNQLGMTDTERQQKLQDVQMSIAAQKADPNSPYSKGLTQFYQSQGIKVPAGMSGTMLESVAPQAAKLYEAKLVAETAGQATKAGEAEHLATMGVLQNIMDHFGMSSPQASAAKSYMMKQLGVSGTPTAPTAPGAGWKVIK